jgi:spermidine/putrescine transport system ATP-binding protein
VTFLGIEAITKKFGALAAVSDFALEVPQGEFVSLLGPSGCGKSTLLRVVAGLEFPDRGRVLLEGQDITQVPAHKRPVNMVFQRVTLFPHLNVHENVAFGLRLQRVGKNEISVRVRAALELVRLPGFGQRAVQTLSGGQAQRVALARAIVSRPKVLLLDEPLSALDLQIRRELQVELREIHAELGGTFLYVTHDQEEAMTMSDRVVVMRDGRIMQAGTPVELYTAPASVFVASFVGSSNLWQGTLVQSGSAESGPAQSGQVQQDRATIVDIGDRKIAAGKVSGARPGEPVWVVLRAESVELSERGHDRAAEDLVSVAGVVADVRFVGPVVHYKVRVGERHLTVSQPSQGGRVLPGGQEVIASWRPEDALVLAGKAETDRKLPGAMSPPGREGVR